jgi:hypothetical protein
MVGVRLPAARLKQLDKLAGALSCDRSTAIRWLLDRAMDGGLARSLLRSAGKGHSRTDEIALAVVSEMKAKAAASAVKRARPADKPQAEIKALRAEEDAAERKASIVDRLTRSGGLHPPARRSKKIKRGT